MKNVVNWLAVDWGTSRLRTWAMDIEGNVVATTSSQDGAGKLKKSEFADKLYQTVTKIIDLVQNNQIPTLISGMAGARNRWQETNCLSIPFTKSDIAANLVEVSNCKQFFKPYIIPGLAQSNLADVMRGEGDTDYGVVV